MMPVQFDVGEMIIEKGGPVSWGYIFTDGKLNVLSVNTRGAAYTYVSHYEAHFVGLMEIYSGHDTYCCSLKVEKRCSGWLGVKSTTDGRCSWKRKTYFVFL